MYLYYLYYIYKREKYQAHMSENFKLTRGAEQHVDFKCEALPQTPKLQ